MPASPSSPYLDPSARPPTRLRSAAALAGFGALTAAAAAAGARASGEPRLRPWYRALSKPAWQPPASAFPVVWTALYSLTAASGARVFTHGVGRARRRALGWWGVQLALNAAWTPLFFGLRRPRAALADAALLAGAVALYARAARRVDKTAARLVWPYLAWVGFAVALNTEIVRRNPRLASR